MGALPRVVTCGARGVTFHRKRKERELVEAAGYGGAAPAAAARKSQKAGEEGEAQDAKSVIRPLPSIEKCDIECRYRDRAAERRQGVSLDYVDVVEVWRCS